MKSSESIPSLDFPIPVSPFIPRLSCYDIETDGILLLHYCLQITKESQDFMVEEYRRLRQRDTSGGTTSSWRITVRQLESMIRLSEGMARLHCQDEVSLKRCTY